MSLAVALLARIPHCRGGFNAPHRHCHEDRSQGRPRAAGRVGETVSLAEQPGGENDNIKQIVFVNDDFRLTFVSRRQILEAKPDNSLDDAERFDCTRSQPNGRIGRNGRMMVASVGPPGGRAEAVRRARPAKLSHADSPAA